MGEVWLAEQSKPLHRRVALKVIKAGMDTRHFVARFEAERQVLALLDHPNVATVFDGGTSEQGRPYFVMEYVKGEPITVFADQERLTIRERIDLFLHVCEGVQHAHQKGIIHRDLKPSNILVAHHDGRSVPKIIDFGVAKATTMSLTDLTLYTQLGTMIGTLEYMSPEQTKLTTADVDTRSDVYSLGVILYELLTGTLPFDPKMLRDSGLEEAQRIIRNVDPPRPSTRASGAAVATNRRTEPAKLSSTLRGDLDWIVIKSLDKDRGRRYASAAELAADLQRYLNDEPVVASPPSKAYRLRKFTQRYRIALATAAVFASVLIVAAVVSIRQGFKARQEQEIAEAVTDFVRNDILAQASARGQAQSGIKPDPDLKVRTTLDRAETAIAGKFTAQPLVEAAIRYTVGIAYSQLGIYQKAQSNLERSLSLRRDVLGATHKDTLESTSGLVHVYSEQGNYARAETLARSLVALQRNAHGADAAETLEALSALAGVYFSKADYPKAEEVASDVLEASRRRLGDDHPDTMTRTSRLAQIYLGEKKYATAEPLWAKVVDYQRRVLGENNPSTLFALGNQAITYFGEEKYAEAELVATHALESSRRISGENHPDTLQYLNVLAVIYFEQGKFAQAATYHLKVFDGRQRVYGADNALTLRTMSNLAETYEEMGDHQKAQDLISKTLEIQGRVLGTKHPNTLESEYIQAEIQEGRRHYADAEETLSKLWQSRSALLGATHPDTLRTVRELSRVQLLQQKYADCERTARIALDGYRGQDPETQSILGASVAGQGRLSEAEPILLAAYDTLARESSTFSHRAKLTEAGQRIVSLYREWKKPQKYDEWLLKTRTRNP